MEEVRRRRKFTDDTVTFAVDRDSNAELSRRLSDEYEMPFRRSMIIHEPRTLDESYYIGLETQELSDRNHSQVIS
jgi:hypothetical protein